MEGFWGLSACDSHLSGLPPEKISQGGDFDVRIKEDKGIPVWIFSSLNVSLCVIYLFRQMQSVR